MEAVAVGSASVDMFVYAGAKKISRAGRAYISYPAGGKTLAERIEFHTGGGGTNVSAGLAKLGIKTAFVGSLGDDYGRHIILDSLARHGVRFAGVTKPGICGYSVILDGKDLDRSIIASRGVNDNLRYLDARATLKANWLCFSSMLGESLKTQKKLATAAAKKGIRIAYNPSLYMIDKGISGIVKMAHLLSLNKEEAEALAGMNGNHEAVIKRIHGMGPKTVCITDGPKPAYCYDGRLYRIQPSRMKVVESTGAGDAFFSGFLAGTIRKYGTEQSLKIGMANSESVIGAIGAKHGLLTMKEALRKASGYRVTLL
ncbi:MAG TPA: carbohydrate kinase family protein [archaeon]|nr:carbohydrate kinase family protein [archaeon]